MKNLMVFGVVSLLLMANSWALEDKFSVDDIDSITTIQGDNVFVEELEDALFILGGTKLKSNEIIINQNAPDFNIESVQFKNGAIFDFNKFSAVMGGNMGG